MAKYTFQEIEEFNIDSYIPAMGWIGNKRYRIYSGEGFMAFFLLDLSTSRLFRISNVEFADLKVSGLYENMVQAYLESMVNFLANQIDDPCLLSI